MYTPSSFAESDTRILGKFMADYNFATLISHQENRATASHLPLLLECSNDEPVGLVGHMARANPQWREADGTEVLAIFHGPHAYVSPRWYEEAGTVPTWNYAAVHAYGTFQLLPESETRELLLRSVAQFEAPLPAPWSLDENDPKVMHTLLPQIVGFRIAITRLEGKWKLNQNHSQSRRERVINQLRKQTSANSQAIADLMQESLDRQS